MAKTKPQEWDGTASGNTDIDSINIAEGCSPSGLNNAMRAFMAQIKTALTGSDDGMVTGTAGADGRLAAWNADGDVVDAGYSVVDQDDMADDSAVKVPTQQSVKAYVTSQTAAVIDEDDMATDSATRPPSQQSVKAYVDSGSTTHTDGSNAYYGARAFARVSTSGTPSFTRNQGFTGSITDHGTGDVTLTLTTAMPDTDFTVIATTNIGGSRTVDVTVQSASTIRVKIFSTNDSAIDGTFSVVIFD